MTTPDARARRRRRAEPDASGRMQIIDAAIASILEVGFHRSSTNEIARRSDVSWGALQYHFGTREALLLAIVEELDRRFLDDIESAHVDGDTVEERVTSLYGILARHYDDPTFLVRLQIVLNLQHDPDTSADVMAEIADNASKSEASTRRLLAEAIGPGAGRATSDALFHALRGFALSKQLATAIPVPGSRPARRDVVRVFLSRLAAADTVDARR